LPLFYLDEAGMNTGVRALLALTTQYLANGIPEGTPATRE
jgi:hypothetical protein